MSPTLQRVLGSAVRLQEVVSDAELYAGRRDLFVHDHVLADLVDRHETVLGAVEASDGWATSVRVSKPPVAIMGSLWGVEDRVVDECGDDPVVDGVAFGVADSFLPRTG